MYEEMYKQIYGGVPKRLISPGSTRWLSIVDASERVIKYWDGLKLFFDQVFII